MPYIKHIPIHPGTHLKNTLKYINDSDKAALTAGINCPENIDASISIFKMFDDLNSEENKKKNARIAHHYVQSFEIGKVSSKEAHDIGVELTKIIAPGYMCHVATHADKDHIHNHIFIFSVHPETGYRYRHNDDQYKFVQEQSDAICIERGIRVIENPKKRSLSTGEYRAMERGGSWKDKVVWDIDDAINSAAADSSGKEGFINYLEAKGYIVKYQNKNISIELPGNKALRVDTLARTYGTRYTKENIERRLNEDIIEIRPDDMNAGAAAKLPSHMKRGDTERFNEYDRYKDWCVRKNNEIFMEAKKRSPPNLDIYKVNDGARKDIRSYNQGSKGYSYNLGPEVQSKEERKKGGEEKKIRSFRDKLAWDIDDAIKSAAANSSGREGFISYLRAQGYIVKYQNKNISIQIPGRKAIRVDNLAKTHGNQYTKENIERRLEGQYKEEHEEGEIGTNRAYSRRWINLFGGVKSTHRNKYGKTKDEREIEKEMEDIGRAIGRMLRGKRLKTKPIKGTWTMNGTINKAKKREKER